MNRKTIKTFIVTSIGLVCLYSCFTTSKVSNRNLADNYREDATVIHPQYVINHINDSVSCFYYKINRKELLYSKNDSDTMFKATIKINYRVSSSYETDDIIDSGSVTLDNITKQNDAPIIGKIMFKAKIENNYLLTVSLSDVKRNQHAQAFLNVNKMNHYDRQDFLVMDQSTGEPLFRNYLKKNDKIAIKYTGGKPASTIHFSYYRRNFPIAAPPFAITEPRPFSYAPDSIFRINLNDSNTAIINTQALRDGFFHIQVDTTHKYGLTLFKYPGGFPTVNTPEQLLQPLRYLTTKDEFEKMNATKNPKLAVDKFWLGVAGDPSRAKSIIRIFYNRVENANKFFTSYIQGWKTDRGMIYVVFGPPNTVYKTANSESWTYGQDNNLMSLTYTFVKVNNPFSDNDYSLQRSTIYKNSWYRTVDIWRQGRVYLPY